MGCRVKSGYELLCYSGPEKFWVFPVISQFCSLMKGGFPTLSSVKGKAIPLHVWTGPEGSIRLRLPDFKTVGT